ncbi:MAG: efflux RND transporter permease subunit [candidate division KSB1 bacterium]|nr:efflux RND transporter permease subunit [candidate division KSB1 bacterium]
MSLIKFAINRPTAVLMFFLAILVTGLMSLYRLPLELTPEVDYPKLSVTTSWFNSSAEMVEAYVTSPIEAVAQTLTDVRKVSSVSSEGESQVDIELIQGARTDFVALELNEKLAVIRKSLPYGTSPPRITKYIPEEFQTSEFLSYQLFGNFSPLEVKKYALEHLRGPLLSVPGVAEVEIQGGLDEEIHVILDESKCRLFDITHQQVAQTIRELSAEQTVGHLVEGDYRFDLVVRNPLVSLTEIAQAIIRTDKQQLIRIQDVASVVRNVQDATNLSRINGNPAIRINIIREPGTNTIQVADRVFQKIDELSKKFPPSMRLIKLSDQSEAIREQLRDLGFRSIFSVLVIFLVLLLFLHKLRMPLIILTTIFFSVLLTMNFFYAGKIGLNLLTLAGLSLGFGMLVDNSVVVLDNIERYWRRGVPLYDACHQGTAAVTLAIMAATLTTVVAFVPFLYLTGELRLYYVPFVMAVGLSLLSSLLVAFTLIPSLSFQVLKREPMALEEGKSIGRMVEWGQNIYQRFLSWGLHHRWIIITTTIIIVIGSYLIFDKFVTKGRIWSGWGGDTYIAISIHMPAGADIESTDEVARFFEEKIANQQGVEKFGALVTRERAYIRVYFPDSLQLTATPLIIKENMTAAATQLAGLSIGVYGFGPGFFSGGGGQAANFRLKVLGYNYNQVKQIAERVGERLQRYSRVRDIDISSSGWGWWENRSELVVKLNRDEVAKYRLSNYEVLQALRSYLRESLDWQRLKIDGKEIDFRIKMAGFQKFNLQDLKNTAVRSPNGQSVRLERLATIEERKVLSQIVREDQQYQRWITFEYRGPWKLGDRLVESIIKTTHLPPGYELTRETWGFMKSEEQREIYRVLALSILLVFMVTAALFESLRQPFIVILSIPLALVGVSLIFYLTDTNFDRSAYIGVIFLSGIVVNNAIILIDHINLLRRQGRGLSEAIINGAVDRLRPILMTTGTTIVGLLPLVLFAQEKTSIWFSLALSSIGGLTTSTFFVLTVIPVVYDLFQTNNRG